MMKMKYIAFPLESVIYDGEEILKRIVEHCRKGKILDDVICKLTIIEGEPVKCKDCKYWAEFTFAQPTKNYCGRLIQADYNNHNFGFEMDADDFCSRGEKK